MTQHVVVGVDGSPAAAAALTWAAEEARLRGAELVVWTIIDKPPGTRAGESTAAQVPGSELDLLTDGYPVTLRHGSGTAAKELIAASARAVLLVVGSRGRNPMAALLLGSVSRACLAQAPCPVVVVRPQLHRARSRGRVIVGVDMSSHSRRAQLFAAEEARLRGATLHAVHAVHWDNVGAELITPTREQLVGWGRDLVAVELAATGVTARPVVIHGHATDVLVRHSTYADLLVVGARGRGSTAGMLLGSVSNHCAQHAHCPVMIVHQTDHLGQGPGARARTHREST